MKIIRDPAIVASSLPIAPHFNNTTISKINSAWRSPFAIEIQKNFMLLRCILYSTNVNEYIPVNGNAKTAKGAKGRNAISELVLKRTLYPYKPPRRTQATKKEKVINEIRIVDLRFFLFSSVSSKYFFV